MPKLTYRISVTNDSQSTKTDLYIALIVDGSPAEIASTRIARLAPDGYDTVEISVPNGRVRIAQFRWTEQLPGIAASKFVTLASDHQSLTDWAFSLRFGETDADGRGYRGLNVLNP
jgi:hypothetical protein